MATPSPAKSPAPRLWQLRPDLLREPTHAWLRQLPRDLARNGRQVVTLLVEGKVVADPPLPLLGLLRRFRPRLALGKLTLLTGSSDVESALTTPDRYRVTPYGRAMDDLLGPFALGLDGPEHLAARTRLLDLVAEIDTDELASWAAHATTVLLRQARLDGRLDVVGELAGPLTAGFVHRYLNLRVGGDHAQCDQNSLLATLNQCGDVVARASEVFEACFLNLTDPGDRVVRERGASSAAELVSRCPAGRDGGHLAGARAGQAEVDRVGLVVGAIPTTIEAIVRIVSVLLARPEALAAARHASTGTGTGDGSPERLWRVAREALRFAPQSPALARATDEGLVLASTYAAMHDPRRVPRPDQFDPERPDEIYLHFGTGPHQCVGETIARELILAAIAGVVAEPGLAPLAGPRGRLEMDGPMVARYVVSLQGR